MDRIVEGGEGGLSGAGRRLATCLDRAYVWLAVSWSVVQIELGCVLVDEPFVNRGAARHQTVITTTDEHRVRLDQVFACATARLDEVVGFECGA